MLKFCAQIQGDAEYRHVAESNARRGRRPIQAWEHETRLAGGIAQDEKFPLRLARFFKCGGTCFPASGGLRK